MLLTLFSFQRALQTDMRGFLWRSAAYALGVLLVLTLTLSGLLTSLTFVSAYPWLDALAHALAAVSVLVAAVLAFPATVMAVAGLYIDDMAQIIEHEQRPAVISGKALPLTASLVFSLKTLVKALGLNLLLLPLLFVPVVNIIAYVGLNGYLVSREYTLFAAMRHMEEAAARVFFKTHKAAIMRSGVVLGALMLIPVVNLMVPVVATITMTRFVMRHSFQTS